MIPDETGQSPGHCSKQKWVLLKQHYCIVLMYNKLSTRQTWNFRTFHGSLNLHPCKTLLYFRTLEDLSRIKWTVS